MTYRLFVVALSVGLMTACATQGPTPSPALSPTLSPLKGSVDRILTELTSTRRTYDKLIALCDDIGYRLSGSPGLEKAVEWAMKVMRADGLERVRKEPVKVPHWVRGNESAHLVHPRPLKLPMLGLGGSVGTGPQGIQAEVVVVADEKELKAMGDRVKGKIVLFNNRMPAWSAKRGSGYGHTVRFRVHGPRLAAALGAVAVLVRSVTHHSLRTPHTGGTWYKDAPRKIPAAAITVEDAALLARFQKRGKRIVVRLMMEAKTLPDAISHNVIGELRGREKPDEIVIISGHLDAWDVGQGAHDDASGVVMAMEGVAALKRLKLRPRRTIRVVLWTNEENGLRGARTYAKQHRAALKHHVAALEADSGGFAPYIFGVNLRDKAKLKRAGGTMREIMQLLRPVGKIAIKTGSSAADVGQLVRFGVPGIGLYTYGKTYFDYHHTPADTVDKVKPDELARSAAALTALAWVLAEMPGRLGQAR